MQSRPPSRQKGATALLVDDVAAAASLLAVDRARRRMALALEIAWIFLLAVVIRAVTLYPRVAPASGHSTAHTASRRVRRGGNGVYIDISIKRWRF